MSSPPLSPRPQVYCPACEGPLRLVGRLPVRCDALPSGIISVAQPGDSQPAYALDAYRCQDCGRLEFYDHDFLLPAA